MNQDSRENIFTFCNKEEQDISEFKRNIGLQFNRKSLD
jgi:hypothetical protein